MARTSLAPLGLVLALAACGGPPASTTPPTEGASAGGEAAPARTRRARRPAAEVEASAHDEEFPLGAEVTVSGTGVRFQPPRGSRRSSIGSTFIHPRRRIQIVVAAAEGDASVHEQFLAGLEGEADPESSEELPLDGVGASLVVDRLTQADTELERVWVVARRGTRSVALMAVYAAAQSESLRGLVRASVLTAHFDGAVPLDPEASVGWRLPPVEGLSLVRTSSTSLNYSPDGAPPAPGREQPTLFVVPLPFQIPSAQREAVCPQVLAQLVSLPPDAPQRAGRVDAGEVQGCDLSATIAGPTPIATYAALVFRGDGTFMVGGTVPAADESPWIERFRGAARTITPVEAPALPAGEDEDDEVEAEDEEVARPARAPRRRRPVDDEESDDAQD